MSDEKARVSDLTAVILAGGRGSRLQEETAVRPKPMVEIGGKPILWHIMKVYSHFGVSRFVVCLGYRGYLIKEYFANYFLHNSDVTFDLAANAVEHHVQDVEPWRVSLVDTGDTTMTGGRLLRVGHLLPSDRPFFMTYGDGLADLPIDELLSFHQERGRFATMTVVDPPARFGAVAVRDTDVSAFIEKPLDGGGLINGGFFVLEPTVLNLIRGDETVFEDDPLPELANRGQLSAFRHTGFWKPMDTLRERNELQQLWSSERPPWKVWG